MSTKASIKWRDRTASQPGFHLYFDVLDDLVDGRNETAVYLRLDGVAVHLETTRDGDASVTVELPQETARALGLIPDAGIGSESPTPPR
ncbi:hypothetical protein [Paraburkholderia humisilvae]|uniref:Uncharacterized protein n=1 Tax=Paraburkholderia humisilvae TaxID=627669 RepID=A0A6J5DC85_9BURK|nr:hypothetical protein [Paraburkholderia humisilvae]CAB3751859.1 hypothetical protein LMG29542_01570 [Paraburkholderia humisilvae]